jgi:hypothetical protein
MFEGMDWIHMAHDMYHFKALVNTTMNVLVV